MRRWYLVAVLLLGAVALAAAGCGGGKKKEASGAEITCEGSALTADPGLPKDFPVWDEVTLTESRHDGPALVVSGYFTGDKKIQSAHDEYKNRFEAAGYTVLFDEVEDKDSEVSYKDAQGKTSGQVAMKAECDNGNISVHITNRPA
jgi:hypothetical protein